MPNELPSAAALAKAGELAHRWHVQGKTTWRFQFSDELALARELDAFQPGNGEEVREVEGFKLNLNGRIGGTTLPTEVPAAFQKEHVRTAWNGFIGKLQQELPGCTFTANVEASGQTIDLPVNAAVPA